MTVYLTTPIYYVNASPHLGHAYSTIAADVMARYQRLRGREAFMLTGTDEHGTKIADAAAAAGERPQAFADRNSQRFRDLLPVIDADPDFFIRTTDAEHVTFVQRILTKLHEQGDVYEDEYSGPYCTACEAYYTDDELLEGELCPIHKTPVTTLTERNWFFRLSAYGERLEQLYAEQPDWVRPKVRFNEALSFIKGGLRDISISRSSITWGVPLPWDPEQVTYVWVDALFNYASALTYARPGEDLMEAVWPPDVQILAKDILKFHAVIWPALLMAADLELPGTLFIHGYLLMGGEKMSKSGGNVFDPFPAIEQHGADAVRFYVMREVQFGQDGSVSQEGFETKYNAELANDLGNLVSRSASMITKYTGDAPLGIAPGHGTVAQAVAKSHAGWEMHMEALELTGALDSTWELVRTLNKHVEDRAPWALAKDPAQRALLEDTLAELAEGIVAVAVQVSPFMPSTSVRIAAVFGVGPEELALHGWGGVATRHVTPPAGPLFPRIESSAREVTA